MLAPCTTVFAHFRSVYSVREQVPGHVPAPPPSPSSSRSRAAVARGRRHGAERGAVRRGGPRAAGVHTASSRPTTASCPLHAVMHSGVLPYLSARPTAAPAASSRPTTASWPFSAALNTAASRRPCSPGPPAHPPRAAAPPPPRAPSARRSTAACAPPSRAARCSRPRPPPALPPRRPRPPPPRRPTAPSTCPAPRTVGAELLVASSSC